MSGFVRFSLPIERAVFSEYPASTAARVALNLACPTYASAKASCFPVSFTSSFVIYPGHPNDAAPTIKNRASINNTHTSTERVRHRSTIATMQQIMKMIQKLKFIGTPPSCSLSKLLIPRP